MRLLFVQFLIATTLLSGCKTDGADSDITSSIKADNVAGESEGSSNLIDQTAKAAAEPSIEDSLTLAVEPFAQSYRPPKRGTVYTYHNNWASLPKIIKYKVSGIEVIGRQKYVKLTSVAGLKKTIHAYYDIENFNLKGYRDSSGKPIVSYQPAEQRYRFPLKPGDRWITNWRSKDHKKDKITSGGGVVRVEKIEQLELPFGVYKTVRVRLPVPKNTPRGMTHHLWFSPKLGVTVKEQIMSDRMNWTQILAKVDLPGN